jgi:hypothetical protein
MTHMPLNRTATVSRPDARPDGAFSTFRPASPANDLIHALIEAAGRAEIERTRAW